MTTEHMNEAERVLKLLEEQANPDNVAGMARFGIRGANVLGISVTQLRAISKELHRDHALAQELWNSGVHEARILASLLDNPGQVTAQQMDAWVADIDSWDLCDQCCQNLFVYVDDPVAAVHRWKDSREEFVKRAAYSLIASMAVRRKDMQPDVFIHLLTLVESGSSDERNFVKKSVSWALRQIGKRNVALYGYALTLAEDLSKSDQQARRWVGRNAVAELSKPTTLTRVAKASRCDYCNERAVVVRASGAASPFFCDSCGKAPK